MILYNALCIKPSDRAMICLVGAGGKTTTMFNLASALKAIGQRVLVTTTTKIFYPHSNQYDAMIMDTGGTLSQLEKSRPATITCLGAKLSRRDNKIIGVDKNRVDKIYDEGFFDTILVEGDGAKRKPIKAPGPWEPVIPRCTTQTLGIIGLDALGKPVNDKNVHRWKQFCATTKTKENDIIDENIITRLIASPNGLFKDVPKNSRCMVLLNKAETLPNKKKAAMRIRLNIEKADREIHTVIASAKINQVFQW